MTILAQRILEESEDLTISSQVGTVNKDPLSYHIKVVEINTFSQGICVVVRPS